MNEPANFLHGSVDGCNDNQYDFPPYVPRKFRVPPCQFVSICLDVASGLFTRDKCPFDRERETILSVDEFISIIISKSISV